MLDMSWGEVMVIGGVALIVIGPKDLPKALRTVGQVTGKIRRMAGEFHTQFNEAMREADLADIRKDLDEMNRSVMSSTQGFNPIQTIRDEFKGASESRPSVAPTIHGGDYGAPPTSDMTVAAEGTSDAVPPEAPVVEEVGAPPSIEPVGPIVHHPDTPAAPAEITGPGLEQLTPTEPATQAGSGERPGDHR